MQGCGWLRAYATCTLRVGRGDAGCACVVHAYLSLVPAS